MIHYQSNRQLSFADFALPFNGALDSQNRWVKLAYLLPWDDLVGVYARDLSCSLGRPTQDLRIELGTLIIQELMDWSDREVISQIRENPYLQYFLGYDEYAYRQVFDASLLVTIRKRLNREAVAELTRFVAVARAEMESKQLLGKGDKDQAASVDPSNNAGQGKMPNRAPDAAGEAGGLDDRKTSSTIVKETEDVSSVQRHGQLILDASAAELEIPYPTDLGLLNEARLQSERLLDLLWSVNCRGGVKPRTYRRLAKFAYWAVVRKRRKSKRAIRKGIKQQLQYLRRNLNSIKKLHAILNAKIVNVLLTRRDKQLLETIRLVYEQQKQMYDERSHRIDDRIVNLYQPWVRPIKRGKSGSDVEFGPKFSVSLVEGMAYVDHFSWDAYNEANYLEVQVESYYQRYGYYPEVVMGDTIYGNRENRRYLKSLGIRFSGKKLGRPVQITDENRERLTTEKQQRKREQRRRNRIEGCFGVGRRRYSLGRVRTRLEESSETAICMTFFAMSIAAYLAACFARQIKLWWRQQKTYHVIIRQIASLYGQKRIENLAFV